jgi:hypothetical protein
MSTFQDFINQYAQNGLQQPRSRADLLTEAQGLFNPLYNEQTGDVGIDYGRANQQAQTGRNRYLQDAGLAEQGIIRNYDRGMADFGVQGQAIDRSNTRGMADFDTQGQAIDRSYGRGMEDFGVQRGLLNRQQGQLGRSQQIAGATQREQLAQQGLGSSGGLGNYQREDLANTQQQQNLGMRDAFSGLGRQQGRFGEDIGLQRTALGTQRSRFGEDIGLQRTALGTQQSRFGEDANLQRTALDRGTSRYNEDFTFDASGRKIANDRAIRGINRSRSGAIENYASDPYSMFPDLGYGY